MPMDDLKDALEGRGFAAASDQTPSLAGLLPLFPEPELSWLGRRAATELAVDSDLRFIRFQNMVLPDLKTGQPLEGLNLSSALGEVIKLLDPQAVKEDPLVPALQEDRQPRSGRGTRHQAGHRRRHEPDDHRGDPVGPHRW